MCARAPKNVTYACITCGLRWIYGARIQPVSSFSCGLRTEAGGGREISYGIVRIHGRRSLYDFVIVRSLTKLKNRKPVARRHVVGDIAHVAQSPHGHRAEAAR